MKRTLMIIATGGFAAMMALADVKTATANEKIPKEILPAAMVGTWQGKGDHYLASKYLHQRTIACTITLASDGTITGKIGDATIKNSSFHTTSWFLRLLGNAKYQCWFDLEGPIVAKENFIRPGGIFFLDKMISDTEMECAFNSYGPKFGHDLFLPIGSIRMSKVMN